MMVAMTTKKMITLYVEEGQLEQLRKLRECGYNPSATIRRWIKEGLERMSKMGAI